ncbi:hypothetical protein N7474_010054 [Penicillium riverlandense]|uniref:uncharacterized protein n=1 Tax=Penicillium riverlandense TaxID=1903569 RepID=UPI0025484A53|nr:uncharacterized protein N7474_010054 [Penicillium riverlandense]KAJ5808785.1 hypothetical protein N7474_010054 [Penicillium riverlandense]
MLSNSTDLPTPIATPTATPTPTPTAEPIATPTATPTSARISLNTGEVTTGTSTSTSLSTGARAGIGVGAAIGIILLLALAGWFGFRRKQRQGARATAVPKQGLDERTIYDLRPAELPVGRDKAFTYERSELPADQQGHKSAKSELAWKKGGCLKAPPDTVTGRWENRKAFVREPWRPPPEVFIDNRETAVQKHKEITSLAARLLVIYTDGSGYEGLIGAAMIVDLDNQHRLSQMGIDDMSTVYAAELRAIEMALDYVRNTQEINNGVVIF